MGLCLQQAVAVLLSISLLTASIAHTFYHPYTAAAPKKLFLLHFHEQVPGSQDIARDEMHLLATDPVPVEELITSLALRPGMDAKAVQVDSAHASILTWSDAVATQDRLVA